MKKSVDKKSTLFFISCCLSSAYPLTLCAMRSMSPILMP